MRLEDGVRWMSGYVEFCAQSGFLERFLNECAKYSVPLWNTRRDGVSLYARCRAVDYWRLRPIAKRTATRVRVTAKRGVPFRTRWMRRRAGLMVGAVLGIALVNVFSGYIWVVEVHGNERVPTQTIVQAVETCGVKAGGELQRLDIPSIQLQSLRLLPDLSWLTVNVEGSVAKVMVSERKEPNEHRAPRNPANVKAAADGVIVSMEIYEGDALVKVGDAVTKGMLLVSGVRTTEVGDYLTRANANIMAHTTHTLNVSVPLTEERLLDSGKTLVRPTGYLFGIEIPWYSATKLPDRYTATRQSHLLRVWERTLPIGWYVDIVAEQTMQTVTRTENEAEALAKEQMAVLEQALQQQVQVRHRRETSKCVGNAWQITVECDCVENIAVQDDILIAQNP